MKSRKPRWAILILLLTPGLCRGQQAGNDRVEPNAAAADASAAVQRLSDSLRQLQSQMQDLNAQIRELRDAQKSAQDEAVALRAELSEMRRGVVEQIRAQAVVAPDGSQAGAPAANASGQAAAPGGSSSQGQTFLNRIARLEESQDVTAANVREISQTKVESGSKYRLRLSGIILLNMFENRGTVDNLDIPEIALLPPATGSSGTFGGTVRQSQIEVESFGPDVLGARTSANLTLDFAGGFVAEQNGATKPLVRLRTANVHFDWANTSIVAGQDSLFIAPVTPSSLASLAVPALAYAGDLWSWTPQIRIEHRIPMVDSSHLLLQGGILDSLTGDVASAGYERYPTWGEHSGQAAYAGRVAWTRPAYDQNMTFGVGGYYARQDWGFGRDVDGWAATADMDLPLGQYFELTAAFYRGRAVGGLGGGVGQSILTSGPFASPQTLVRGLDSMGGWGQVKFKPRTNFEVNAALGEDNPFAGELKQFPSSPAYYGTLVSRNWSPLVNFIYQARSDVLFSAEYRRLRTYILNAGRQQADLVNLSLGYTF